MRYMVMHKVDANMEAGGPPSQQIIQNMGALVQQSLKDGTFTTGAGLHRSARRARIACEGGSCTVSKGPYAGGNELLSSFAMIKAKSLDDAVARGRQLAEVHGDVEIEIGPVVEPWDLGVMAKPAGDAPARFLLLCKGNPSTESGAEPSPKRRAALAEYTQTLADEGVLLMADTLAPSAKGARLTAGEKGKRRWVDGPFTESKELIAGFSVLEVPSRAEAIAWAERYAAILGGNEVDVRELAAP
jgi:hypothetical protein